MNLKRFFLYSVFFHLLVLCVFVLFLPPVEEKRKGGEFITRLVSPDELPGGGPPPAPLPRIKSRPQRPVPPTPPAGIRRTPSPKAETGYPDMPSVPSGTGTPDLKPPSPPSSPGGAPGHSLPSVPPSIKERLFDRSVISEFAKRTPKKEEENKNKTFTFDTSEYRFLIYNRRLKEKIESIWKYPPEAASRGIYGDLVLRFTIQKNGRLKQIELVRTSGYKFLDDAAMKALKDGEPYWPLPDEWGMQTYTIVGHFVYTIYGYHIR